MSGRPALGLPAPGGMFGAFRSWLRGRPGEPWRLSETMPAEQSLPLAHCFGAVRVLVVDDNPVNLMLMQALMGARGLVPWLAADGAEAVALASGEPFDLILMDLQMPVLDGLLATSAIRRFETTRSRPAVPVIAYSSAGPGAGLLARHGFSGNLNKPCEDQDLEDCLVQWCPSYRSAPAARGTSQAKGNQPAATRVPGPRGASLR